MAGTPSLGQLIDKFFELREKKQQLEKEVKQLSNLISDIEQAIICACDEQQLKASAGNRGSITVVEQVYPEVTDWEAYYEFIYANRYAHLLERRPSVTGFRELYEQGRVVPGVQPFVKRSLRARKA